MLATPLEGGRRVLGEILDPSLHVDHARLNAYARREHNFTPKLQTLFFHLYAF